MPDITETRRRWCKSCRQYRLFERKHQEADMTQQQLGCIIHILLTIITGGIWILVFLVLACLVAVADVAMTITAPVRFVFTKPWKCPTCGRGRRR